MRLSQPSLNTADTVRVRLAVAFLAAGFATIASIGFTRVADVPIASTYRPRHHPALAVDGRPMTFWAPAGHTAGTLDFYLPHRQTVSWVGLLNARSRYQTAFATRNYTVRLYSGATILTQVSGSLDTRLDEPKWEWRYVDSRKVDHIQVRVAGTGGQVAGLAEFVYE